MLKLALCDDDPAMMEILETYFEQLKDAQIDYDVYFSAEELYNKNMQQITYDVYILDIEMQGMNGLELAKSLRNDVPNSLIIFLTSYSKYVFDVFEAITFDFLLKPIQYDKFEHTIKKIKKYLHMTKAVFAFSYRKNSFSIPCEEILYIKKSGRKAYLYTKDKEYVFNMNLEGIWGQLDTKLFAAIHTSYIVNLLYIREIIRDELVLKNGEKLYVGKKYCQKMKTEHLRFVREKL